MIDSKALLDFVEPYYADKDIMHDMWHIELVKRAVDKVVALGKYEVDAECLTLDTYFNGFIYVAESEIRQWMQAQKYGPWD